MTSLLIRLFVVMTLILSLNSLFFAPIAAANSENQNNFAHDILKKFNDSFCDYEGNLMQPVFYCTFENKKALRFVNHIMI